MSRKVVESVNVGLLHGLAKPYERRGRTQTISSTKSSRPPIQKSYLEQSKRDDLHMTLDKNYHNLPVGLRDLITTKFDNELLSFLQAKVEKNPHNAAITTLRKRFLPILEAFVKVVMQVYVNLQLNPHQHNSISMDTSIDAKFMYRIEAIPSRKYGINEIKYGMDVIVYRIPRPKEGGFIGFGLDRITLLKCTFLLRNELEVSTAGSISKLELAIFRHIVNDIMRVLEADIRRERIDYAVLLKWYTNMYASFINEVTNKVFEFGKEDLIPTREAYIPYLNPFQRKRAEFNDATNVSGSTTEGKRLESNELYNKHIDATVAAFLGLMNVLENAGQYGGELKFKRTKETVHVLGRDRSIFVHERKKYITYKRSYVPLTTARSMSAK